MDMDMGMEPTEVVRALLAEPTNPQVVERLVAVDATYVSLNFDDPELKRIMPWTGTSHGRQAVTDADGRVWRFWRNEGLKWEHLFGSGDAVAVFGRFTYRSATLGRAATSPFAILAEVREGQVRHMCFLEDTFATAQTFRTGGTATYRSDPDGGAEVSL